jgi:hypothetical protein
MARKSGSDIVAGHTVAMPPSDHRALRVVVALEMRLEREVICSAMEIMRPHWSVTHVSPEELDKVLRDATVDVIVCSTDMPRPRPLPRVVIVIHPFGDNRCTIAVDGRYSQISRPSFSAVLSVIDRVYG